MPAGDEKEQIGEIDVIGEPRGERVAFQMVDREKRFARGKRDRLGGGKPHHDATDQTRPGGSGHGVKFAETDPGLRHRRCNNAIECLDMRARRDFRHHATERRMRRALAQDDIGTDTAPARGIALNDGSGRFVATRLDAQNNHQNPPGARRPLPATGARQYAAGLIAALTLGPAALQSTTIRIGSRGSPLARAQADEVARRLAAAHPGSGVTIEIVALHTTGDRLKDVPLTEAGGKGLFTKEIEEALIAGEVDIAVHSAKDMPTVLPSGLVLAGCLEREDPRDVFIGRSVASIGDLPQGAVLGTSSLRRRAMALRMRPDLSVVEFRGNVGTRLENLKNGIADGTLLAMAGLRRLKMADRATSVLDPEVFVPAIGQGAIAIEVRTEDAATARWIAPILHADTGTAVEAERTFLAALDGSCRTPIGGHARIANGRLAFHGIIVTADGRTAHETKRDGNAADAARIGRDAGEELARRGGPDFFRH